MRHHKLYIRMLATRSRPNKVWHVALIVKLHRSNLPLQFTLLINPYYLTNPTLHKINKTSSTSQNIKAGVPQSSVLGPTLFNILMYDLPNPPHIQVSQYVDDTAIYKKFIHLKIITKAYKMERTLLFNGLLNGNFK